MIKKRGCYQWLDMRTEHHEPPLIRPKMKNREKAEGGKTRRRRIE